MLARTTLTSTECVFVYLSDPAFGLGRTPSSESGRSKDIETIWEAHFAREGSRPAFLQAFPPAIDRLKTGLVEKLNHENSWQKRQICLTENSILFARQDSEDIIDRLDLLQIATIGLSKSKRHKLRSMALV